MEPESVEPEPVEPELAEPELAWSRSLTRWCRSCWTLVLCADPGRARASAPAVTTLATVTVVVVDRTLARPRSLAASARRIPLSRRSSAHVLILRCRARESLHEPSGLSYETGLAFPLAGRGYPANMKVNLKGAG